VGISDFSPKLLVVAAKVPDAPGKPAKFTASTTSIEIRWNEPVNDGGSAVTDYTVWWDEGRGTNQFVQIGTTDAYQTFTVDKDMSALFKGGSWYLFRVAAVNIVGQGAYT